MGYDMIPWKLVFCEAYPFEVCMESGPKLKITSLPTAPEPGRIPRSCDHVHVRPKLSGDQRDARGDMKWRTVGFAAARCEHGRIQGNRCYPCPGGWSPDRTGHLIGYAPNGDEVRVPDRERYDDIKAWFRRKDE